MPPLRGRTGTAVALRRFPLPFRLAPLPPPLSRPSWSSMGLPPGPGGAGLAGGEPPLRYLRTVGAADAWSPGLKERERCSGVDSGGVEARNSMSAVDVAAWPISERFGESCGCCSRSDDRTAILEECRVGRVEVDEL